VNTRTRTNIFLLGLIVLLTTYIHFSKDTSNEEVSRLSNIDYKEIVQIKVQRNDLDDFEFNKDNETWQLSSPQQFRANSARVNAMLKMLSTESFAQLDPSEVDLDQLGLADPIIIMKLNDHEFKFGNTDAIDQRRYVLFDNKIHLTNDFLYQQLLTNAAFFADPKLLPENFKIQTIQFPDNKLELINNEWTLNKVMDIHPDQLKRIIFNWESATAISANKYDPVPDEKEAVINISFSNNKSIQFVLVSTDPHIILGRKDLGIQFHMGSDETNKLLLKEGVALTDEVEPAGLELH
jgi:Domain of unknown function (DUF4340)